MQREGSAVTLSDAALSSFCSPGARGIIFQTRRDESSLINGMGIFQRASRVNCPNQGCSRRLKGNLRRARVIIRQRNAEAMRPNTCPQVALILLLLPLSFRDLLKPSPCSP